MSMIFDSLPSYAGSYSIKKEMKFTDAEIAAVRIAKVVPSQYGTSCCFYMHDGCQKYIPMARDTRASVGDVIDLHHATVFLLSKEGADDILRLLE